METVEYQSLYALQDQVINEVFAVDVSFYLTGGTCLNRFYLQGRYSEDLDFFTNEVNLFRDDVRVVRNSLRDAGISSTTKVDTRDFVRIVVENALQVDCVNDRVYRSGRPIWKEDNPRARIDTVDNIAANKISAILGRDEPKDIFDLYICARVRELHWSRIVIDAQKKASFSTEDLEYRLRTFPGELLYTLSIIDNEILSDLKREYSILVDEICTGANNTLRRL